MWICIHFSLVYCIYVYLPFIFMSLIITIFVNIVKRQVREGRDRERRETGDTKEGEIQKRMGLWSFWFEIINQMKKYILWFFFFKFCMSMCLYIRAVIIYYYFFVTNIFSILPRYRRQQYTQRTMNSEVLFISFISVLYLKLKFKIN